MILIISKEHTELSTEEVIDWIDFFGKDFIRINGDEFFKKGNVEITLNNSELVIKYKDIEIPFGKINSVWFRRWWDRDFHDLYDNKNINYSIVDQLIFHQSGNIVSLRDLLFKYLDKKKWLSHPSKIAINKIHVLVEASKVGLNIPETKICSTKKELIDFFNIHKKIISKDLNDPIFFFDEQYCYTSITNAISRQKILNLPDEFFPSFFQKLVEKKFEIRVFYLNKKCYSMAIFSQSDKQTKIDFRNYNEDKPNRFVPYKLPRDIEKKIIQLMQNLDLTTGSIDMIKNKTGDYIFLEINPVGQFGMVSKPCNYYLEKEVAEYLISQDNG
ncbi:MAG: grasp-with-spasm system ATP-grasp peptide maturase [Bacteroidales bacterium]|nr:grasp-with-spasm system ATP-grasp peptide maturase [Bacteroidales bacterium]